jgi:hypothetical protein
MKSNGTFFCQACHVRQLRRFGASLRAAAQFCSSHTQDRV